MYYCKNCGELYSTDEAVLCVKCGTPKDKGNSFCRNCGNAVNAEDSVCYTCGVPTNHELAVNTNSNSNQKSRIVAGLLAIFFGCFGVHNFYLGYTARAVIQLVISIVGILLMCILVGVIFLLGTSIWGLIEGILILCGKIDMDANGNALSD